MDGNKNEKWFQIFDKEAAPKRTAAECGKLLAAKLLMGAAANNGEMDKDGKLSYSLSRPKASHVDLLYLDKTLQVLRASSGTVYVHVRLPGSKAVHESVLSDEPLPAPLDPFLHIEDSQLCCSESAARVDSGFDYPHHEMAYVSGCNEAYGFRGNDNLPLRKTVSESDLCDPFSQEQESSSDARLQELEAYAVVESTPSQSRSCLKRVSSYGDLEEVGTNIPINSDRKAWMALPKPTRKCDVPKNNKKLPARPWARLKHTLSDTNLLSPRFEQSHHLKSDNDTIDTNSIGSEDSSKNLAASRDAPKLTKAVSFSCLEIRSYDLCVGDNPACSHGAPVSLDWTYEPRSETISVMAHQNNKEYKGCKHHRVRIMDASERHRKLCNEFGTGMAEIRRSALEVERVKRQRKKSLRLASNPSAMKVEVALDAVQRRAQRVVKRLMPRHKKRRDSTK